MLVARRDPPFESGAHTPLHPHMHMHLPRQSSRFVSALQIVGTLVGIPVGLATIYSVYHSSFTVEARCETLRANIVGLLDKSADATTLRMLVKRDVTTFEDTCGAVDPDAVKAFKHLLAARTAPAPQVAPVAPATAEAVQKPIQKVQKPVEAVKQAAPPKPAPVVVESKPVRATAKASDAKASDAKPSDAKAADSGPSDEKWVASVREALIHSPAHDDAAIAAPSVAPSQPAPPPRVLGTLPTSLAPPAVPALPAPVAVAAPPAPPPTADHPVPPGSIPNDMPAEKPAEAANHSWMSKVPILNRVVGN